MADLQFLDLGKVAYDAYCEKRGWKSFNGDALPPFNRQSPDLQVAWEAAAQAAIAVYGAPK